MSSKSKKTSRSSKNGSRAKKKKKPSPRRSQSSKETQAATPKEDSVKSPGLFRKGFGLVRKGFGLLAYPFKLIWKILPKRHVKFAAALLALVSWIASFTVGAALLASNPLLGVLVAIGGPISVFALGVAEAGLLSTVIFWTLITGIVTAASYIGELLGVLVFSKLEAVENKIDKTKTRGVEKIMGGNGPVRRVEFELGA